MGLIDKLVAIGEGFRSSRGTTKKYTLDEMAVLAGEPVGGGGDEWEEQFIAAIERDSSNPVTKLPDGVTKIGNNAFYDDKTLALTSLPSGVTEIGNSAFYSCSNLALTQLPDNLLTIGQHGFYYCTNLDLTFIPPNFERTASYAFTGCSNLKTITFRGKPISISPTTFGSCTNLLTINVPWAEGEVGGAPWGATNATINYNYTGG